MKLLNYLIITSALMASVVASAAEKKEVSDTKEPSLQSETPKKKSVESKKKGNSSEQDMAPLDADEAIKKILESSKRSEKKKRVTSHKKKSHKTEEKHTVADSSASHHSGGVKVDPEEAIKRLIEGNRRYVAEKNSSIHRTAKRRAETSSGQHPFAVIVGCSDSRVPPEIIFDQGIGDLFIIRTAGNVLDDVSIGSIEYAVEHLGTELIMVLGHEKCGAVDATLKGGEVNGKLKSVVDAIKPAVEKAKSKGNTNHECDILCSSVKSNARMVAEKLKSASPVLSEVFENGMARVVGAYYDLDSGLVTLTYKPLL